MWNYLDEPKERERKRFGLPSWRDELELIARAHFVEACIDCASESPDHKARYDAAVRDDDELKAEIAAHESRDVVPLAGRSTKLTPVGTPWAGRSTARAYSGHGS